MNTEGIELLTEILDLAAGLSVAPELIGTMRLEQFREKLVEHADSLKSKKITKLVMSMYGREDPRLFKPVWYLGVVFSSVSTIAFFLFVVTRWTRVWSVLIALLFAFPAWILSYWVWLLVLTITILVFEFVLDHLLAFPIWISKKATLSRTLLFVGFLFFLASSLIKIST